MRYSKTIGALKIITDGCGLWRIVYADTGDGVADFPTPFYYKEDAIKAIKTK